MTAPARADARFYDDLDESSRAFHARVDAIPADAEVLELGCGVEALAFDLADRGARVVGISPDLRDVEQARLEAARRGLPDLRFTVMSAENLYLDDRSTDVVVGVSCLHRVDIARTYAEMARVLRPDGRVLLLEPLGHNPIINAYRRRTGERRVRFEHPIRREELSLASRWFGSVDVETHHLFELAAVSAGEGRAGRAFRAVLRKADRVALRPSSPLRWQAWIAVVELRDPRP